MKYIDIHGHIVMPDYDADRDVVYGRARTQDVGLITVGTNVHDSAAAVKFAENHEQAWATVGIHPTEKVSPNDMSTLRALAAHPKVVAIGECGLDFFHSGTETEEEQREVFEQQIELANSVGKPLMLHVRNSKDGKPNAYAMALDMLKQKAKVRANFHFFAGSVADAQAIFDIGGYISFTGVITFASNYDDSIRLAPLESIMSETDCPFVAPKQYRGTRNEPSYVIDVVKQIAVLKNLPEDQVAEALVNNARRFFGLSK